MLSVSSDTVRRWITQDRLSAIRVASGQRRVEGPELARFVTERAAALERPAIGLASARNRLPGVVTRVVRDTVMAQVELQAGPFRVVSLMSREAADELHLEAGVRAVAAIKATNVVIEIPDTPRRTKG